MGHAIAAATFAALNILIVINIFRARTWVAKDLPPFTGTIRPEDTRE